MIKWTLTVNDIGAEGARMLSESLKTNTTLTSLDLSCDENEYEMKWNEWRNDDRKKWKW